MQLMGDLLKLLREDAWNSEYTVGTQCSSPPPPLLIGSPYISGGAGAFLSHSTFGQQQESRPLGRSNTGLCVTLRMLRVKSDESDWLRIWNYFTVHAQKVGPSWTKRSLASVDKRIQIKIPWVLVGREKGVGFFFWCSILCIFLCTSFIAAERA